MTAGLNLRMGGAILSIALILVFGMLTIGWIVGMPTLPLVAIAVGVILLQYWISPYIIRAIYRIDWVGIEALDARSRRLIQATCDANGVAVPRFGVIHDRNPNAFCFGWHKGSSFLVLTDGIDAYCTPREKRAVIAHELGHIVHNDFIVMTMICMVPLIFYVIGRSCLEAARHSHNSKGSGPIVLVGIVSMAIYFVSQLIVLLVSRYREYWADNYSARATGDPGSLSSALVKIAYGLASEGNRKEFKQMRYENALMISDPRSARSLAASAGNLTGGSLKEAMSWDMWNPWASLMELWSSHPLPGKRILVLDKLASDMGKAPAVGFDLVRPRGVISFFGLDIAASYLWVLAFPVSVVAMMAFAALMPGTAALTVVACIGMMMSMVGMSLFLRVILHRYPKGFEESWVDYLSTDAWASPQKGIPVKLRGKIIGRGNPGLIFNEDVKIDDGTGIVLVDYNQVMLVFNLIEGLFKTESRIGKEVTVTGWFRRSITPYVELYEIECDGKRKRMHTRTVKIVLTLVLGSTGILIQLANPLTLVVTGAFLALQAFLALKAAFAYDAHDNERINGTEMHFVLRSLEDSARYYGLLPLAGWAEGDRLPDPSWRSEPDPTPVMFEIVGNHPAPSSAGSSVPPDLGMHFRS